MKFLVDAQLPKKLSFYLNSVGFESYHTLDLPNKNFTSDKEIIELSLKNQWIVISKDQDFYNPDKLSFEVTKASGDFRGYMQTKPKKYLIAFLGRVFNYLPG